ncbi:MAG: carboxypeptidase-like regulatory domain-containing protein [Bacteroidetes bacterium]|nr:carboxypeptidase-like regulatory domain-containing protein [Bacteroidota bacterium]
MKTLSILVTAMVLSIFTMAQQPGQVVKTIKGKVISAATNEAISYTNIGLEGTFYGTASDDEGNFELKVPLELVSKNIFFSAVGFKNKQFPVKSLFDKEFNVIKIESQSYGIEEIDIAAQNMVLIRILRMASENIKYNNGAGPFNMHCSYNNERTVNDKVETPQIASVLIYDAKGYSEVSKSDAFVSRKYSVKKEQSEADYTFSSGLMNIDDLLGMDWARSASNILNPALLADYKLSLESQPKIDGQEYWVIVFSQDEPTLEGSGDFYASAFKGKITINKVDYSVLKIEGEVQSAKNNRQGLGLAVGTSNKNYLEEVSYNFTVDYKDLLLNRISMSKSYKYEGKSITDNTVLKVDRAHSNNLTILDKRDYFPGE